MAFCEHCQGQRFDRAQVLRIQRATRKQLRMSKRGGPVDRAMMQAIEAVRSMEIPHLAPENDGESSETVH